MTDTYDKTISVVIPVYNTGKYIGRCLDSVLSQTLADIEVICVDDLSTDGTPEILSRRAAADPRVKVVLLKEKGYDSGARNAGLDVAAGEWVYFMDSDDWIDPDYLEAMLSAAERCGDPVVINANYVEEFEDEPGKKARSSDFGFIGDNPAHYPSRTIQKYFPPVVWTRLYRRKFLIDNNVRFAEIRDASDVAFTAVTTLLRDEGFVFKGPMYHYFQRRDSIMKSSGRGFADMESFSLLFDDLQRRGISPEGLRMYYLGPVMVDTEEKFLALRSFFLKTEKYIRGCPDLYVPHDLFVMDAVLGCGSFEDYLTVYGPSTMLSFIRHSRSLSPKL